MISEFWAKQYCSEDISLIENYQQALADRTKMWEIHHRRECDSEGRTLFTCRQLMEMNLYLKRPASELIFVTKSMHKKLHREQMRNFWKIGGKIGGKIVGGNEAAKEASKEKNSIPILQFAKDGTFVKEWPSTYETERQLGIHQSNICACLKGRRKFAGGFVWRYAHGRR